MTHPGEKEDLGAQGIIKRKEVYMKLKKKNGVSYKTIIKNTVLEGFMAKEASEEEKKED